VKATETKPAVAQTETSEGRPQSGRGRRERQPRHDRQATANDSNLSVEQIAEKTQAEVQAMSRAAMDRINAKVDEVATPLPTAAAEENPRRSARAERMSRPDRWERQVAVDPSVIPAHQADSDPALIAAQDAAADSLMGNRALRAHTVSAPTEVSTSAPEPVVAPAATIQEPAFVVQTQFVAETSTTQHIDQVDHTESTLHEAAPTDDAITTTEESTTEQPPRRTGTRRGLYRRRTGGRRPNNRRDGATDEHAPTEHTPSESN
jgi:hypothetical protein